MKTKANFSQFFQLLRALPNADKETMVWQYSNMKTISLREFYAASPNAYRAMIFDMQKLASSSDNELRKLRSGVLTRLQKIGVDTTQWHCVNAYLSDRRIAGRPLYELSPQELVKLITKLEAMITKKDIKQKAVQYLKNCN